MNGYQPGEIPAKVRGPRRTLFILLVVVGLLASAVMAVVVWAPDDWRFGRSTYNSKSRTCYGISRENPVLKKVCGYEGGDGGMQTDCIIPLTGVQPRVCYGILK